MDLLKQADGKLEARSRQQYLFTEPLSRDPKFKKISLLTELDIRAC